MKYRRLKYLLIPVLLAAGLALGGCMTPTPQSPQETPLVVTSADELSTQIDKANADTSGVDPYGLKGLDHYYVFSALPDGAKINQIKVTPSVVRVSYTFGEVTQGNYEHQMEIVWYRKEVGDKFVANLGSGDTGTMFNKITGPDGQSYQATSAKAAVPTDTTKTFDYCHVVYWSQNNIAYMAAVPVSFQEADIYKYCHAKEVKAK